MPLKVKKQERENSQGVIRRFQRATRQSGVLLRVRQGLFRQRPKSQLTKKKAALRREKRKEEYKEKEKMGK